MEQKKQYKVSKGRLGYITKSKNGKSILKVEQDMTLKAGDALIIEKPTEEIDSLVRNNIITQEAGEERKEKLPNWILSVVKLLPSLNK